MRRISSRFDRLGGITILAAVLAVGCGEVLGPAQDDLSRSRALWREAQFDNYEYELRRSCFCGTDFLRAVRIGVTGGVVSSAVFVDNGEPIAEPLSSVPVIDDLFDEIQAAIDAEAFSLQAEYHASHGYPTNVAIDFNEMVIDEEMAFTVTNLVAFLP